MINKLNILDPNLGIQNILEPLEQKTMPGAHGMAATPMHEAGLEDLYNASAAAKHLEASLCPNVGDGTLLQPAQFNNLLNGALEVLEQSRLPEVRDFVRNELGPLMENTDLLKAYSNLMMGG